MQLFTACFTSNSCSAYKEITKIELEEMNI